ncbi:MAG: T9SS type A sorting domain-containing protein [Bacteroidales bacterium]|nr:T9SS type A sorting domain-containing protein [Bacteroidales bacterium]
MKKITTLFLSILISSIYLSAQEIPFQDKDQIGYADGEEDKVYEIPGKIEIEYFDIIENDPLNDSATYKENNTRRGPAHKTFRIENAPNVDFSRAANVDNPHYSAGDSVTWIGWAHIGEWWEYTVDVQETKKYRVTASYNSADLNPDARKFLMFVDDTLNVLTLDTVHLHQTGSTWDPITANIKDTVFSNDINLTKGEHIIRVQMVTPNINFDFLLFEEEGEYVDPGFPNHWLLGTSVDEYEVASFKVYPNPATTSVNVDLNDFSDVQSVSIVSLSGTIVKTVNEINSNKINVSTSDLSTGLYFVRVETDNGVSIQKVTIR